MTGPARQDLSKQMEQAGRSGLAHPADPAVCTVAAAALERPLTNTAAGV